MIDIAKCLWLECPIGSDCYRLQAQASVLLQTYADFSDAYSEELKTCAYKITMNRKGVRYGNKTETYP